MRRNWYRTLLILVVLLGVVFVYGCAADDPAYTTEPPVQESQATAVAEAPSVSAAVEADESRILRELSNGSQIDVMVPQNMPNVVPVIKARLKYFNEDVVESILFEGEAVAIQRDQERDSTTLASAGAQVNIYSGSLGSSLYYDTGFSEHIFNVFDIAWIEAGPCEQQQTFSAVRGLPFAPRQQIEEQFKELLEKLGASGAEIAGCYALDHETLGAEEKRRNEEGDYEGWHDLELTENWTDSDDCYYLKAYFALDGLDIYSKDTRGPQDEYTIAGTEARALISKDGVQMLEIHNIYENDGVTEENPIIPAQNAADAVAEKLDVLPGSQNTAFDALELVYKPRLVSGTVDEIELVPVWLFTGSEQLGVDTPDGDFAWNAHYTQCCINAYTGHEI